MNNRPRKGDLVIDLRGKRGRYTLHAQASEVRPEMMERIAERIDRLFPWVASIGDEDWPLPEIERPTPPSVAP